MTDITASRSPQAVSDDAEETQVPPTLEYGQSDPSLITKLSGIIVRAGKTTFWPLADQAAVSIGNFLTMVLVARALPTKGEYGIFGLLLELIFYLNTIQSALVIYPLTVKGAVIDDEKLRRMTTASLLITCFILLPAM